MTATVVPLFDNLITEAGVPAADVAANALEACEEIVVLGYTKGEGKLFAAASFGLHGAERTVFLIEQAKAWLIAGCPSQDE